MGRSFFSVFDGCRVSPSRFASTEKSADHFPSDAEIKFQKVFHGASTGLERQ
jgi:hypothetical protein